jgi:leucyl aminopeptidase (aminopeptidase T)
MIKMMKVVAAFVMIGLFGYACKVKQQSNVAVQKNQSVTVKEPVDDEDFVKLISKTWAVHMINYQADARKNVLYERGIDANLQDYSKEAFKITPDEKVVYTDGSGKKHHGTWDLKDNNTKLIMEFEDGQEVAWDIIEEGKNSLVLHLSIDAKKVNWNITDLNNIDIPTAAVLSGFYAGVVTENTERVNITYKMFPRS